ncbi:hypothetical protein PUNSTDRAFT_63998 [Punctularia strigosozonata HHB-11173 SS5]|uniref:uncharacterized protein n=1 Tax=Punctularia strigosozonata (strain HHB-11173) TaxID=741275 RepID=UPI0004418429|nr:uncharacterized protein PUNSTDRAFT_63998 [Punctularia strigosozonata HHB-11173 SS5]EIN10837.1 hypothetical protein PUNSTDRAFT_63998 [Punctularia strigosozonata HHB-11173 SS5]
MSVPPLKGDGQGNYRISIVGNSGMPRSTLGKQLAAVLRVPFVPLDRLFWCPGWQKTSTVEFRAKVVDALGQSPGWVVDGNYTKRIGPMIADSATDIIWLDPPFLLYFPRLCWRTFLRLCGLCEDCSPGCEESFRGIFSRESIVWWCITNHNAARKHEGERLRTEGIHVGGKMRRIGGWGDELVTWQTEVDRLCMVQR